MTLPSSGQTPAAAADAASKITTSSGAAARLEVVVGKSVIVDSPLAVQRISLANGALVDARAVSPKEILIDGKAPGETSLIVWQQDGTRLLYDLTVRPSAQKSNPESKSDKPGEGK
jgi:pilus assembly protein CpaC